MDKGAGKDEKQAPQMEEIYNTKGGSNSVVISDTVTPPSTFLCHENQILIVINARAVLFRESSFSRSKYFIGSLDFEYNGAV